MGRDRDKTCIKCGSFLNSQGICLNCHPTGRAPRPNVGKPWHGNSKPKK